MNDTTDNPDDREDVHVDSIVASMKSDILSDAIRDAKRRGDTATEQRLQPLLDGLVEHGSEWLERNWPPDLNVMTWR